MYKEFVAKDFLSRHNLEAAYSVAGFLVMGTFKKFPYGLVESIVKSISPSSSYRRIPSEFLEPILELTIDGKIYWFVTAYGGALLSEWVHIASLFGSRANIVVGSCGGLHPEGNMHDIIIPTYSYGDESSTRAYSTVPTHKSDTNLSKSLASKLVNHKILEGPIITHQAMLAETWEDIVKWSKDGYYGVEMEAATVFAVSNYFKIPCAAVLRLGDNLIKKQTVFDQAYENEKEKRISIMRELLNAGIKTLIEKNS